MEAIEFKRPEGWTDEMYANAMMQFIVNRAAAFDKSKFDKICTIITDDHLGAVAYEALMIIGTFTGVKIYVPRKFLKRCRFHKKNDIIRPLGMRKYFKLCGSFGSINLDCTSCYEHEVSVNDYVLPQLFFGFRNFDILFIAEWLYNWNTDRKAYIRGLRKRRAEAKKQVKLMKKEVRDARREAKREARRKKEA